MIKQSHLNMKFYRVLFAKIVIKVFQLQEDDIFLAIKDCINIRQIESKWNIIKVKRTKIMKKMT